MPFESKWYALEERGVRRMASQCESNSVWGSALTMRVHGFRIERDDGNKLEGKTSRKVFTSRRVQRNCQVSLEIGREYAREIYQDSTVLFEVQHASDGLRQGSAKL